MDAIITQFDTPKEGAKPLTRSDMALPGVREQFLANLARFWRAYYRSPTYNLTRFVTTILVSLVFGSMFWMQGSAENRTTVTGARPGPPVGYCWAAVQNGGGTGRVWQ